jgi:hypothetical protein
MDDDSIYRHDFSEAAQRVGTTMVNLELHLGAASLNTDEIARLGATVDALKDAVQDLYLELTLALAGLAAALPKGDPGVTD